MRFKSRRLSVLVALISSSFFTVVLFQNCGRAQFSGATEAAATSEAFPDNQGLGVCNGVSCQLTPLTSKAAVTTILLALGDEANNQLVINGGSSQLIAETVVRYTSPVTNPKILLVRDSNSGAESRGDTDYVRDTLLQRYDVTYFEEGTSGLKIQDLAGYDVVWFNNPGTPMGKASAQEALLAFSGGVILQGDDLAHARNFSVENLTGLTYKDNGTSIKCGTTTYQTDNNVGTQFLVHLDSAKFTGGDLNNLEFRYGNDIDLTVPLRSDLEVLASARGTPSECTDERPAIVRYFK